MQGDESPRDLKFAVHNCGARIDVATTGWKRMLLSDLEMLRVRRAAPRVGMCLHRIGFCPIWWTSTSTRRRADWWWASTMCQPKNKRNP
jgi:hypothetical protein